MRKKEEARSKKEEERKKRKERNKREGEGRKERKGKKRKGKEKGKEDLLFFFVLGGNIIINKISSKFNSKIIPARPQKQVFTYL